jgi:tetratricopeptide (TPR) repeat protein
VGTEAARRLGDLALGAGAMEEARRWYGQAARSGSSPELELALGNLAYIDGRLDEAERRYRTALGGQPGMAEAVQNLGNIAVTRGDTARARELYARALALRPGNAALRAYVAKLSGASPP